MTPEKILRYWHRSEELDKKMTDANNLTPEQPRAQPSAALTRPTPRTPIGVLGADIEMLRTYEAERIAKELDPHLSDESMCLLDLADLTEYVDKLENLRWDAQGELASCTDLLNSWAREARVAEAQSEADIRGVVQRLWTALSLERYNLQQVIDMLESEQSAALNLIHSHGFAKNSSYLEDALRNLLQSAVLDRSSCEALEAERQPRPWPPPEKFQHVLAYDSQLNKWVPVERYCQEPWGIVESAEGPFSHWLPMPPAPEVKG